MNTHKFRVWDKELKKYATDVRLAPDGKAFFSGWVCMDNSVEIEWYTSQHDKNGVDIYEGDIVKYDSLHGDYNHDTGKFTPDTEIGTVVFNNGTFSLGLAWSDGVHEWTSMENYKSNGMEIIGNARWGV